MMKLLTFLNSRCEARMVANSEKWRGFMERMKSVWICLQNYVACSDGWPFMDCCIFLILILLEVKVILSADFCLEDIEGLKIKSWKQ